MNYVEFHKRKSLASIQDSLTQSKAEALLLDLYDRELLIDDFVSTSHGMAFYPSDMSGRKVAILLVDDLNDIQVSVSLLDADIVVFCHFDKGIPVFVGWITNDQLLQADRSFNTMLLYIENLFKMPLVFDFKVPCPKVPCSESAIWNYETQSWDCFMCERHRLDEYDRTKILAYSG